MHPLPLKGIVFVLAFARRLPYPRTPPGKEVEDASVFPASAATEIGLALHSGGELSEGTCKVLTRSLTAMGYSFRYHAVWKSLTVCPPHEALIRRLARVVGVQLPTSTGKSFVISSLFWDHESLLSW